VVWCGVVWCGVLVCSLAVLARCVLSYQDTKIAYRPYFFNPFNLLDIGMIGVFAALMIVHIAAGISAENVDWGQVDGFVNVFNLAQLVRAKVYLLAVTVFIVWIKTLEHLRVNRSLSTFILIIKGMVRGCVLCVYCVCMERVWPAL